MPTLYARTLARAAELLGSEEALAVHLGVPLKQLRMWIQDRAKPPTDAFVAAADIVGQYEIATLEGKKPSEQRPEADSE